MKGIIPFGRRLSPDDIDGAADRIVEAAREKDDKALRRALRPLQRAQRKDRAAARRLVALVDEGHFDIERSLALLEDVFERHGDDPVTAGLIGEALESARDIDMLNAPPPTHPLFAQVLESLEQFVRSEKDPEALKQVLFGLSNTARMMARQHDDIADAAYSRLVELFPDNPSYRYNYGLFLKTRGRFADGLRRNLEAAAMAAESVEAYEWNTGICATGAGEGDKALEVWLRRGQKLAMGRFKLPDGGYPPCKVRLAERPLAARDRDSDDPGLEETIWIERLSPCHGIVRSVLYRDLGIDYGDVVLFDGAPITYHSYGDEQVPVFPQLATLARGRYRFFEFAGTQQSARQLEGLTESLGDDIVVYSHSENLETVCSSCWRDPGVDHEKHDEEEKQVVTGRIALAPDVSIEAALQSLDDALTGHAGCQLFSPNLCLAAGQDERARFERRRYEVLAASGTSL